MLEVYECYWGKGVLGEPCQGEGSLKQAGPRASPRKGHSSKAGKTVRE